MNMLTTRRLRAALTLTAAAALAACAVAPTKNTKLDEARALYQQAAGDPAVVRSAPLELRRAQDALQRADMALRAGEDIAAVEHQAYLARQQSNIALQTKQIAQADQAVSESQARRDRILLDARTRESDSRLAQAQRAGADAERARVEADNARKLAEERLAAAQTARDRATAASAKADKLQAQLQELQAQQTDRGMVLTLGDVLFDTGRAELKPGAMQTIDRLAVFMRENPERKLSVEGYTDSVGGDALNLTLSQRRADAVRDALAQRGVDLARIETRGFGKASPVASNDTAAGRQRNRRIEIVIAGAG